MNRKSLLSKGFDTDKVYWDIYPELKLLNPFKDLYKADRSAGKHKSGKMVWLVAAAHDITSPFSGQPKEGENGIYETIGQTLFKDKGYYEDNKKEFQPLIVFEISFVLE